MRRLVQSRITWAETLLMLIFAVVATVAVFMGNYLVRQHYFSQAQRGVYGKNAIAFLAQSLETEGSASAAIDVKSGLLATVDRYRDITLLHAVPSPFMTN